MLSRAQVAARPSVLWCYKKELGFSSNKKKRMKLLAKKKQKGLSLDDVASEDNVFDNFLKNTEVRYCYYKESEKILGNTFGMCILQVGQLWLFIPQLCCSICTCDTIFSVLLLALYLSTFV